MKCVILTNFHRNIKVPSISLQLARLNNTTSKENCGEGL